MIKYFINLTNGLEILKEKELKNISFIRIQSTACEQHRWNWVLSDIDNNFLMNLAIGNKCIVIDYYSRGERIARSLWQGLEFIKYVLNREWFGRESKIRKDMLNYFREEYKKLDRSVISKIRYYKKFLLTNKLDIETYSRRSTMDGKYDKFRELVKDYENKKS